MAFTASAGSCSMMHKSAAAGPVGRRRSCSQFCSVFTLTPINCANSDCERLVRSRMTRTPEGRITVRREGFCWPNKMAPASRTLPSSSSNMCLFTAELLFDNFGEPADGPKLRAARSHSPSGSGPDVPQPPALPRCLVVGRHEGLPVQHDHGIAHILRVIALLYAIGGGLAAT